MQPLVSVIIPTRDRKDMLLRLLSSVFASAYPQDRLEVVVVDNASIDGTAIAVATAFPAVRVVRLEKNAWAAGGRNAGAAVARGTFHFFIDDDNVLERDCIRLLAEALEADPRLGIAGPLHVYHSDPLRIWCAAGQMRRFGLQGHAFSSQSRVGLDLPAQIASDFFPNAYMLRRGAVAGPPHDAVHFPHNWNEQDLAMRIRAAGYSLRTVTSAVTRHDIDYVDWVTRTGIDKTFDQARARIVYRRIYLRGVRDWLAFWLLVFPVSTMAYAKTFSRQKEVAFARLVGAYFRGTLAGLTETLP